MLEMPEAFLHIFGNHTLVIHLGEFIPDCTSLKFEEYIYYKYGWKIYLDASFIDKKSIGCGQTELDLMAEGFKPSEITIRRDHVRCGHLTYHAHRCLLLSNLYI